MLDMTEIERRRAAIRYHIKDLAKGAGCDHNTAARSLRGINNPRHDTAKGLGDALIAEERKLLRHLLSLHPQIAVEAHAPQVEGALPT